MDGNSFGRALGESIITLIIMAALIGGVVGVALWVAIPWVFSHLSVTLH